MTTSREPLILSDTAMVLLRRYEEFKDHQQAVRDLLAPYSLGASKDTLENWRTWLRLHNNGLRSQLENELLEEIQLLWRYPDLRLVRHLDWHLRLEADFITWAEGKGILVQEKDVGNSEVWPYQMQFQLAHFFIRLSECYIEALGK
jgi:hypothetical protein